MPIKIKYITKTENYRVKAAGEGWLIWNFLNTVCSKSKEVEWVIAELKKPDGEPNLNDCWAVREGELVNVFHTVIEQPELFIPYNKFINLLEQWKLVLEQQQDKSVYDHDYDELTILADDDYNFTVMVDGKMIEKQD